jgi:hypothetical protein
VFLAETSFATNPIEGYAVLSGPAWAESIQRVLIFLWVGLNGRRSVFLLRLAVFEG